jgi:4-amino-4-deoxy-L-arabinose transferase-like glycosyltransferase
MSLAAPRGSTAVAQAGAWQSFVLPLVFFLAAYLAINVVLTTSFHADEAEQILFSQSVDAGYEAQPPLYTWLAKFFFTIFGLSFFAFALLKAMILGAVFIGLYLSARAMQQDRQSAALAAFSIFLIPLFCWSAVGYLTHTILLAAACTCTFWALLRIHHGRDWGRYALLGLMLGLGALTKYNYVLFTGAILLSALTIRSYRCRLLDRRMLLALAIAAALMLPHALYLRAHWQPIVHLLRMKAGAGAWTVRGAAKAARDLITNVPLIVAPLAAVGIMFFPQVLRRRRPPADEVTSGPLVLTNDERARANLRLLERYFVFLMAVLALVIVAGAKRFNDRWLQPFALVGPLYLFGRLRGVELRSWRIKAYAVTLAGCAVVLLAVRAGQLLLGGSPGCPYALSSFAGVAAQLHADLGPGATTVASQRAISGNLCYWLPDMRHLCSDRPLYFPPARSTESKLALIWDNIEGEGPPLPLQDFVADKWRIYLPTGAPARVLEVRSSRGQIERLRYLVLPSSALLSARYGERR